jgi:hypothetical protein
MPPHKFIYMIVGVICAILAILGGLMYPLNTVNIFWIILYEVTVCFSVAGILLLIRHEGFEKGDSN